MNFGKFKDAESLLRSYENLEKEFTKKCQELAKFKQKESVYKTMPSGAKTGDEARTGGEAKTDGTKTNDKIKELGNILLDKVNPPEESKCSKSKRESGVEVKASDLEEAGANGKSPFCGILEKVESVLDGATLFENNVDEGSVLEWTSGFNEGGSLNGSGRENKSQNGNRSLNGSKGENFNGSGSFNGNGSLTTSEILSEGRSQNGSEQGNDQSFTQNEDRKTLTNGWSDGNNEESSISPLGNVTASGEIEKVKEPQNNLESSDPGSGVIGTVTPAMLEEMLEKARTDGIRDYIKRVLDKKSNSPKLLGKGVRGDGLILNSGVKPLGNIREAGNYILKNYFFD